MSGSFRGWFVEVLAAGSRPKCFYVSNLKDPKTDLQNVQNAAMLSRVLLNAGLAICSRTISQGPADGPQCRAAYVIFSSCGNQHVRLSKDRNMWLKSGFGCHVFHILRALGTHHFVQSYLGDDHTMPSCADQSTFAFRVCTILTLGL